MPDGLVSPSEEVASPRGMPAASSRRAETRATGVTLRAVVIGALAVAVLSFVTPYLSLVIQSWIVGGGSLMNGPVVVLFLLLAANRLLLRSPWGVFSRSELLTMYLMMIVSVGFLLWGGLPFLLGMVSYPFYMASPGNNWQHLMWPYVPLWLQLHHPDAINWFWEGMPQGTGVPWLAWLSPGLAWSGFTVALMAAMFCLSALLKRGWIQRQRLAFPLADVPLALLGDDAGPSLARGIMGRRVFWIGFAVPALVGFLNALHRFFPEAPAVNLWGIDIGRNFIGMGLPWNALRDWHFSVMFDAIGIMCLVPSEVSLSLWFFYVLYQLQLLVGASFGFTQDAVGGAFNPAEFIMFEEAGAFLALSALVVYEARHTLRYLWRSHRRLHDGGADEAPLARWATGGFLAANGFMLWFALRTGMQWWAFVLLMVFFYSLLLGCTRVVAAAGVMTLAQGAPSRDVAVRLVGAGSYSPTSLMMYAYLSGIYMDAPLNLAMPQMMNGFRLADSGRISVRSYAWVTGVAVVVMLAVGFPAMLGVVYRYGASALGKWPFAEWPAGWVFNQLDATYRTPETSSNLLRLAVVVGAGITLGLVWLNAHLLWWPFSPIGFLMASSWEFDNNIWSNALIAWLITVLIKRYGGLQLYRRLRPAFLGLVLGAFLSDAAVGIVSTIFDFHRLRGV